MLKACRNLILTIARFHLWRVERIQRNIIAKMVLGFLGRKANLKIEQWICNYLTNLARNMVQSFVQVIMTMPDEIVRSEDGKEKEIWQQFAELGLLAAPFRRNGRPLWPD